MTNENVLPGAITELMPARGVPHFPRIALKSPQELR